MIVCIMEDTNINAVISRVLKLAVTRSKMPFLPKQRGRHLLALPRHSQSMSKVLPLFDTAVCCCWTQSCGAPRRRAAMSERLFTTQTDHCLFPFFMASCALWWADCQRSLQETIYERKILKSGSIHFQNKVKAAKTAMMLNSDQGLFELNAFII